MIGKLSLNVRGKPISHTTDMEFQKGVSSTSHATVRDNAGTRG